MKPRFNAGVRGLLLKWWKVVAEQLGRSHILTEIEFTAKIITGVRVEGCISNRKRLGRTAS